MTREDQARTLLVYNVYMWQSSVMSCGFTFVLLFDYVVIKVTFNVSWFPLPSSLNTNLVTLVQKPGRKKGRAVGEKRLGSTKER